MKITLLTTCRCWQSSGLLNVNSQRTLCVRTVTFTFSFHVIILFFKRFIQALLVRFKEVCLHADLLVLCKVDFLKRSFLFSQTYKLLYEILKAKRKVFTLASSLIMENICASLKRAIFFTEML